MLTTNGIDGMNSENALPQAPPEPSVAWDFAQMQVSPAILPMGAVRATPLSNQRSSISPLITVYVQLVSPALTVKLVCLLCAFCCLTSKAAYDLL